MEYPEQETLQRQKDGPEVDLGREGGEGLLKHYWVFFGRNRKVLEIPSGDGCIILGTHLEFANGYISKG